MGHLQHYAVVCALALASGPAYAAAQASGGSSQAIPQASFRYWDRQDGDATGWQLVTPLSITSSVKLEEKLIFDASIRVAHIISDYNATVLMAGIPTPVHGRVDAFSDTVLGGTLTYLGMSGLEPFLTIDLNLPTGQETLFGSEKNAIMDPDLVDQIRFGEGFNANFSAGAAIALSNRWVMTAAVGYNTRGDYVPDGDFPLEYDPADQLTAYLRAQYLDQVSMFAVSVKYFDEDMATLGGLDYFNSGDRINVSAEGTYQLSEKYVLTGYAMFEKSGKNQYLNFFTGTTVDEEANGNGNVYHTQLSVIHLMGEVDVSLKATATMRDENDYDPVNDLFIPRRTTWDVGPGVDWHISERATLSGGIRFGELYDDPTPFIPTETTYTKFSSFVSGVWSF
jgi:hypothetical protein